MEKTLLIFTLVSVAFANVDAANPDWSVISGKLRQLDIGPGDILWGVNSANRIYMRNGNGWYGKPGLLTHVTVGSAGVWGVNKNNHIYYLEGVTLSNPVGSSWTRIAGLLIQIDSGPKGIVYGVNRGNSIYCRLGITTSNPKGSGWRKVPGSLKYVSCGPFGCWGVNRNNKIFFRNGVSPSNCAGTSWTFINGKLKQLEVDTEGKLYGVNAANQLYVREGITPGIAAGTHWRYIQSVAFKHISAGFSRIAGLDSSDSIFFFNGKWLHIPGGLKQIDHGLTNQVWGVNSLDYIYRLKEDKGWQQIGGLLKHVSVGEAGVWGVNKNDDIYYLVGVTAANPAGTNWKQIPGKLKQIDSGPGRIVYGVNKNDQIYCRTGIDSGTPDGTSWKQVSGGLKYISCGVLGCWGVNSGDMIYYRSGVSDKDCAGTQWTNIPGRLRQIEVGKAGDVYGINSNNNVYRRKGITETNPTGTGWQYLSDYGKGSHVTTGLNGRYYLVNGKIYESKEDCPRKSP